MKNGKHSIICHPSYDIPLSKNHRFPGTKYSVLIKQLESTGLIENYLKYEPKPATAAYLSIAHDPVYIQAIETGTTQFDISSVVEYNELYWIGVSYRLNDAAVFLCGAQIGPLKFGYSYDLTLSDIGQYSSGSHEIFMEFQITRNESRNQRVPWLKRHRIYTPSNEK